MVTETFNWQVQVGAAAEISYKTLDNEFGDGYSQSMGVGINNRSQAWQVSKTGKFTAPEDVNILPVKQFLDRHSGHKSFYWTPPGGEVGRYRVKGYAIDTQSAGLYTLTWTMQQVFHP